MPSDRSSRSSWRRLHALVEQYTPDGALGRWLLGSLSGFFGCWLLVIFGAEVVYWGLAFATLFWTTVLLGVGVPAVAIGVLTLWPLYLSLIGNIDSAADYSVPGTHEPTSMTADPSTATTEAAPSKNTAATDEPDEGPFADLKRQYSNGDISEAEFERRLESRLADDGAAAGRSRERTPERN